MHIVHFGILDRYNNMNGDRYNEIKKCLILGYKY